jgi:uncharacterized membrane protein (DUF106 family)
MRKHPAFHIMTGVVAMVLAYFIGLLINDSKFTITGLIISIIIGIPVGYIGFRDKKKFRKYND